MQLLPHARSGDPEAFRLMRFEQATLGVLYSARKAFVVFEVNIITALLSRYALLEPSP